MSVRPSVHLSVRMFVCLSAGRSVGLSVFFPIKAYVFVSVRMSVFPSIHIWLFLYVCVPGLSVSFSRYSLSVISACFSVQSIRSPCLFSCLPPYLFVCTRLPVCTTYWLDYLCGNGSNIFIRTKKNKKTARLRQLLIVLGTTLRRTSISNWKLYYYFGKRADVYSERQ